MPSRLNEKISKLQKSTVFESNNAQSAKGVFQTKRVLTKVVALKLNEPDLT